VSEQAWVWTLVVLTIPITATSFPMRPRRPGKRFGFITPGGMHPYENKEEP
jgi:hypothetical protein